MSEPQDPKLLIAKEREKKKNSDRLHLFISATLVIMSYVFCRDLANFRVNAPILGIEMRTFSDIYYVILVAVGIQLLRRILDKCLRAKLETHLMKENLLDLDLRREKLTRQIFDAIYYFSIYIYARIISWEVDYVPACHGGAGTCDSLGMHWPKMKFSEGMRWYIIIQFGHHLHNLVYHAVAMRNVGNYFEMITHHYAAVVSIFYSYFTNLEDYALFVLISHDLSDGFLNFGKLLRDIGWGSTILMNVNFLALAFYWFYHRAVLMSTCYFYKTYEYYWWKDPFPAHRELWDSVKKGVNFVIFSVFLVFCLNLFWWSQIVKIGINKFIRKKKWVSQHEGEIDQEEIEKRQQASKPSQGATSTPLAVDPAHNVKKNKAD